MYSLSQATLTPIVYQTVQIPKNSRLFICVVTLWGCFYFLLPDIFFLFGVRFLQFEKRVLYLILGLQGEGKPGIISSGTKTLVPSH